MSGRLAGRCALVTGGGEGIGRAIALAFAREGASVAVIDSEGDAAEKTCSEIGQLGAAALPIAADVGEAESVDAAIRQVERRFTQLHVLVNNAGIVMRRRFVTMRADEWERIWRINLAGALACTRAALPLLRQQPGASVVNVASIMVGHHASRFAAYSATKGALASVSRSLALEFGRDGIRVNYICPGFIRTEMTRRLWSRWLFREYLERRTPLRRLGEPEDVAQVAVFLASPESAFVTGAGITVDGGYGLRLF